MQENNFRWWALLSFCTYQVICYSALFFSTFSIQHVCSLIFAAKRVRLPWSPKHWRKYAQIFS